MKMSILTSSTLLSNAQQIWMQNIPPFYKSINKLSKNPRKPLTYIHSTYSNKTTNTYKNIFIPEYCFQYTQVSKFSHVIILTHYLCVFQEEYSNFHSPSQENYKALMTNFLSMLSVYRTVSKSILHEYIYLHWPMYKLDILKLIFNASPYTPTCAYNLQSTHY